MYPTYDRAERIADGTIHVIGVLGALAGAALLNALPADHLSPRHLTAINIYSGCLIVTFVASAMYHMTPWEHVRPLLRRFDHAAIFLKIAGTYTPLVVMIGNGFAYGILAIVWCMALIGMVIKLFFWRTPGPMGLALYLGMGWLSLALLFWLWPIMPMRSLVLLGMGGVLFTAGVPFFAAERMKFSMAIWHGFVLTGSTCLFGSIAAAL